MLLLIKDSSGSSDEETSAAVMAQSQKLEESDDDFNSNMFSADTATLSVLQTHNLLFQLVLLRVPPF